MPHLKKDKRIRLKNLRIYKSSAFRPVTSETNYSIVAKGAKVTRHTVAKHYGMIQKMLEIKENVSRTSPDCHEEPLMV